MKKWYRSKTVWLGIAEALAGLATAVQVFAEQGDYSIVGFVLLASGVAKVVLRTVTKTSVQFR